ncbi:MAG TPA: hypothetical protein VHL80_22015, partial [Polyangia bacterium]|nr:hypothetical protein [Polyangia bacterium]
MAGHAICVLQGTQVGGCHRHTPSLSRPQYAWLYWPLAHTGTEYGGGVPQSCVVQGPLPPAPPEPPPPVPPLPPIPPVPALPPAPVAPPAPPPA